MATFTTAPSVIVQENDLSSYGITASTNNAGAVVGNFMWGPVGKAQTISNLKGLENAFGKPKKFNTQDFHIAKHFLAGNSNLFVARVDSASLSNSHNALTLQDLEINEYVSDPFLINTTSSASINTAKTTAISAVGSLNATSTSLKNSYIAYIKAQTTESNINIVLTAIKNQNAKRYRYIQEINALNYSGSFTTDEDIITAVKAKYINYVQGVETTVLNVYKYFFADCKVDFDRQLAIKNDLQYDGITNIISSDIIDYYKDQFNTALNVGAVSTVETELLTLISAKSTTNTALETIGLSATRVAFYKNYVLGCGVAGHSYLLSLAQTEFNTGVEQTPAESALGKGEWGARNVALNNDPQYYLVKDLVIKDVIDTSTDYQLKINNPEALAIMTNIPLSVLYAARYPSSLGNGIIFSMADSSTFETWEYAKYFNGKPGTSTSVAANGGSNDEVHVIIVDKAGNFGIKGGILEMFPYLSKASDGKSEDGIPNYYINYINNNSKYVYIINKPVSTEYNFVSLPHKLTASRLSNFLTRAKDFFSGTKIDDYYLHVPETLSAEETLISSSCVGILTGADSQSALYHYIKAFDNAITTVPSDINLQDLFDELAEMVYTIRNYGLGRVSQTLYNLLTKVNIQFLADDSKYIQSQLQSIANQYDINLKEYYEKVNFGIGLESANTKYGDFSTAIDYSTNKFVYILEGGVDAKNVTESEIINSWNIFADPNKYDPFVVLAGAVSSNVANNIASIFINRKDAITWTSPCDAAGVPILGESDTEKEKVIKYRQGLTSSSYVNMDTSYTYVTDTYNDGYVWIPSCVITAAIYSAGNPWDAPAGYNRAIHPGIIKISSNFDKNQIADLYKYGINSNITDKSGNILPMGDKNLQEKDSQLNRISVRGTLIVIEKDIANSAKYSLFENNNTVTQLSFYNRVNPYLKQLKAKLAIDDYKVVCDDTNNTDEVKAAHQFVGDIYIKPQNSINWVLVNFNIVANMSQVSETTV